MLALYNDCMELNQPAPGFALPDLNGRLHNPREALGNILIINFWSADCPWAKRADQELLSSLKQWGSGVELFTLAANANEKVVDIRYTALERGLEPVLLAAGSQVVAEYGAVTTPHFFVLDASGILRYRGGLDDVNFRQRNPTRHYLLEAVDALRSAHLPDPAETASYGCTIVRMAE
jgi:hypothetical protein